MVRHTNKRRHTKRRRYTRRSQRGGGLWDLFSSKSKQQTAEEEQVKNECETKLKKIEARYSGATAEGATTQGATAAEGAAEGATAAPQIRKSETENIAYRGYTENTNTNRMGQGQGEGAGYGQNWMGMGGRSRRRRRHRRK
jgi:hypothetical protein